MKISVLEELGLTPAEIKIYLALLELGASRAGDVIKHTELQNSVFHTTLGKLVRKGLVSFVRHGKVKEYYPTDPRNITRWIEEKKNRFEEILPALLAKQEIKEKHEIEVFEGIRGFRAMCYKFIEDAEPKDEYLIFGYVPKNRMNEKEIEEVFEFYKEFADDRKRRGLVLKAITQLSGKSFLEKFGFVTSFTKFVDFPVIQNISICRNKIIITPFDERLVAYLVTSHKVADNFRDYFYSMWDRAK